MVAWGGHGHEDEDEGNKRPGGRLSVISLAATLRIEVELDRRWVLWR